MSVRQSLLAILDRGACYGSQLRAEYERRTGVRVNVGQVYTTLERLERDGLIESIGVDDEAHVLWQPTAAGRDDARSWLAGASLAEGRDEVEQLTVGAEPFGLSEERPRRGRPARSAV